MRATLSLARHLFRQTHGQDLIEYALLAAFISLAAYTVASGLGGSLNAWYDAVAGDVAENVEEFNCSPTGIAHSQGKCVSGGRGNGQGGGGGNGQGGGG